MTNKNRLDQIINNLNENGIDTLLYLLGHFDQREEYNKYTTQERLEELQLIERQKKAEREAERKKVSLEKEQSEYRRREEYKAALTGRERKFFESIERTKPNTRYYMKHWEMVLLADTYNNNLINGSIDIFKYGFMKGQRAEKNRRKRRLTKQ